jgi:hypothetical protein
VDYPREPQGSSLGEKKIFIVAIAAIIAASLALVVPAAKRALFRSCPVQATLFAGMARNSVWSWTAPAGVTTTELNPNCHGPGVTVPAPLAGASMAKLAEDWLSYNRTLLAAR